MFLVSLCLQPWILCRSLTIPAQYDNLTMTRCCKTRGTVTWGGASGAPAETLVNMREGTISGMRVSRTTLPRTMKVKRLRVVTSVRAATVRKMLRELQRYPQHNTIKAVAIKAVGTTATPQPPKEKSKRNKQEKCRGKHQGLRSQPKDHEGPGHSGRGV